MKGGSYDFDDSDYESSDYDDSSSDEDFIHNDLSDKYISIINEFNNKPVLTGGAVNATSTSRVKLIPMFPYIVKSDI
jgi:hypothetical protein